MDITKGGILMDLTLRVKELAKNEGASLVGISPVDRFDGAPRGHHPRQIVPEAKSVVSFGVALPELVSDWEHLFIDSEILPKEVRKEVLQNYFYRSSGYEIVNHRLNQIALRLANFLEERGFRSLFFPATYDEAYRDIISMIPSGFGLFSQRHAAVRAGLGEFGLHNVVVTEEFGPRIRFNSVITEAELSPTPLLKEKICLGEACFICVDECAPGAIKLDPEVDPNQIWLDPVSRTDWDLCNEKRQVYFCYGKCIRVCPIGRKRPYRGRKG